MIVKPSVEIQIFASSQNFKSQNSIFEHFGVNFINITTFSNDWVIFPFTTFQEKEFPLFKAFLEGFQQKFNNKDFFPVVAAFSGFLGSACF